MPQVSNVKYGYTDNGVRYKKATAGKKIGTVAGAGWGALNLLGCCKTKVKDTFKTQGGTTAALGVSLGILIASGLGRLIGFGADTIVNKVRADKADKEAAKLSTQA